MRDNKTKAVIVNYSPSLKDWYRQIGLELRRRGLRHGDCNVIANPSTVTNELFTTDTNWPFYFTTVDRKTQLIGG